MAALRSLAMTILRLADITTSLRYHPDAQTAHYKRS
jgi:hypothetical protein